MPPWAADLPASAPSTTPSADSPTASTEPGAAAGAVQRAR